MNDPRHIHAHAHAMLVEQVMAMHGRGSSNPKQYRRTLECMSSAALGRALEETDFPALEHETDKPEIPSAAIETNVATPPARGTLILQSSLP